MYFSKFPVLSYPCTMNDERKYVLARNILRRVALSEDVKTNNAAFVEYNIKDGERPEHIADRVYGNAEDHWILLLSNDIIDPYHDWYKSSFAMDDYILKKYNTFSVFFGSTTGTYLYDTRFFAGSTLTQGSFVSSIKEYHPNLCKFVVDSASFSSGSATVGLSGGGSMTVTINRVLPSTFAVNHFEVNGVTLEDGEFINFIADPFAKQSNQYNTYTELGIVGSQPPSVGIINSTPVGSTLSFWETYIGRYMGVSGSPIDLYAVSNVSYERKKNEEKRTIRVLHPRYLDAIKKELESKLRV